MSLIRIHVTCSKLLRHKSVQSVNVIVKIVIFSVSPLTYMKSGRQTNLTALTTRFVRRTDKIQVETLKNNGTFNVPSYILFHIISFACQHDDFFFIS